MPRLFWSFVISAAMFLPFGWLFLGVYQDREFKENHIFIKHRPSPHFFFRSPIGERDMRLEALPEQDRSAELRYCEFIERAGGFKRSVYLPL